MFLREVIYMTSSLLVLSLSAGKNRKGMSLPFQEILSLDKGGLNESESSLLPLASSGHGKLRAMLSGKWRPRNVFMHPSIRLKTEDGPAVARRLPAVARRLPALARRLRQRVPPRRRRRRARAEAAAGRPAVARQHRCGALFGLARLRSLRRPWGRRRLAQLLARRALPPA